MHGGVPSDCPHRERRGYTGDGQISAEAAIWNFDMSSFYTKWLDDISDAQNHTTGYVPNTAPYQDGGGGTAWGSAYVIIPWYMYLFYGDTSVLEKHYSGMKKWVDYLKSQCNTAGILTDQGLGEWVPPEKVEIPADLVNTCYYYHCTDLMSRIAGVLDKGQDSVYFANLAELTAKAINQQYDVQNGYYSIGRQGADVLPLGFGIASSGNRQKVFDHLVNHTFSDKLHFDTGILATPLLLDVLSENGRIDLAYALMNQRDFPSYGYMIEKGATTIWETWLGDQSHSHPMFGSVCHWFYEYIAGIRPDPEHPGFKNVIIKPCPVRSLDFAKATYPGPYGEIRSNWHFDQDDFLLDIEIPANSTATVHIPARNLETITVNGQSIKHDSMIKFKEMDGQYAVFNVGSGEYHFRSEQVKPMLRKTILAAPVITPGDTLAEAGSSVTVTMKAESEDVKIYYTTDNSEPDKNSEIYSKPLVVNDKIIIKARAFIDDAEPSFSKSAVINFVDPDKNGLRFNYFEGKWSRLPDFSKLKPQKNGRVWQFRLDKINPQADEFGVVFRGFIEIKKAGEYHFYVKSNDGTKLFVNNKMVVDNDGPHGADQEMTGKIVLSAGNVPVKLEYFQAGGGMFLRVSYAGPGVEKQEIPASSILMSPE